MISIKKHSGIFSLTAKQIVPVGMEEAWAFFSSPDNLSKITPAKMGFKITSELKTEAYEGQIITYKIGILPGIKSNWVTEITHIKKHRYFIDEQRFGPYRMWHHEHHFTETPQGVLATDIVSYKLPFGWIGNIAHGLFIRKMLIGIFEHRFKVLSKLFTKG